MSNQINLHLYKYIRIFKNKGGRGSIKKIKTSSPSLGQLKHILKILQQKTLFLSIYMYIWFLQTNKELLKDYTEYVADSK
jgi:hypothetical protein